MKLFCIPYSGGSANIYREWKLRLADAADITPIEYRGHGSLYGKGFYNSIQELRDDLIERYFKHNHEPFIIYGHSLGSIVTFEITCELKRREYRLPEHIVVASLRPPHMLKNRKKFTTMSEDDFWDRIIDLGNTPPEVIKNDELKQIAYEMLYADMKLVDDYVPDDIKSIDVPITAWAGINDYEAPLDEMQEWKLYTKKAFELKTVNGDHFFAFKESGREQLMEYMESLLREHS